MNSPFGVLIETLPASPPPAGAETSSVAPAPIVTSPAAASSRISPPLVKRDTS